MQCLNGCWTFRVFLRQCSWKLIKMRYLKTWNVVFFGNDEFSIFSLKELIKKENSDVVGNLEVVTTNNISPVYKFSTANNLRIHLWPPNLNDTHDIGVIVSFGKFVPEELIRHFPLGIFNVHASLLPKWRGPMPISHSLKSGDTFSGITILKINGESFDTGEIVMKKICQIGRNELLPSLFKRLGKCGSECLIEMIRGLPQSISKCELQSNEKATYAKKLKKDAAVVKWSEHTALEIYNLYRALFQLNDLKTSFRGNPVKLLCLAFDERDENDSNPPGTIRYSKKSKMLLVNCKDKPIRLCSIRMNKMFYSAHQFYRGFLSSKNKELARSFGS